MQKVVIKYRLKKVTAVVRGGRHRQDSVYAAIKHLPADCRMVAIHDGVRPFIPVNVIEKGFRLGRQARAVITAIPVKDTVKKVKQGKVKNTLDRKELWQVQTPQVFEAKLIRAAYEKAMQAGQYVTDDAQLVEKLGKPVAVVEGSYDNIKITTPEDLPLAETILKRRKK
jgi:2-C-methyl-D-erythritol 4-phosphate cytidylyltransferase